MLWLCVFVSTLPTHRTKFDPKSHPCVFVGYPYGKKGYKVLNLQTKKISVSRDLIFHEYFFPFFKYTSSEKYFPSSSNHLPNMSNPSHVPPYSESTIDDVVVSDPNNASPIEDFSSNSHVFYFENNSIIPIVHSFTFFYF